MKLKIEKLDLEVGKPKSNILTIILAIIVALLIGFIVYQHTPPHNDYTPIVREYAPKVFKALKLVL